MKELIDHKLIEPVPDRSVEKDCICSILASKVR